MFLTNVSVILSNVTWPGACRDSIVEHKCPEMLRFDLNEITVHRDEGRLAVFDEADREHKRQLGRRLMGLMRQYVARNAGGEGLLAEAPHPVTSVERVRAARARRTNPPLVLIDLAVPRDVELEARGLHGVHDFDIDDVAAHQNGALAERRQQAPRVEAVVAEETRAYLDGLGGLEGMPLVARLRARAESQQGHSAAYAAAVRELFALED